MPFISHLNIASLEIRFNFFQKRHKKNQERKAPGKELFTKTIFNMSRFRINIVLINRLCQQQIGNIVGYFTNVYTLLISATAHTYQEAQEKAHAVPAGDGSHSNQSGSLGKCLTNPLIIIRSCSGD